MTAIHDDLRREIKNARRHPRRWGNPRGITQRKLGEMTDTSEIWIRQIEAGTKPGADAYRLGRICHTLEIKERWLRDRQYTDVADALVVWADAS